jgi:hypothetical protein
VAQGAGVGTPQAGIGRSSKDQQAPEGVTGMKRGRRLKQTMRGMVVSRWTIMRWYHGWTDYVRRQRRFKRWFAPGRDYVKIAKLPEFDLFWFVDRAVD